MSGAASTGLSLVDILQWLHHWASKFGLGFNPRTEILILPKISPKISFFSHGDISFSF